MKSKKEQLSIILKAVMDNPQGLTFSQIMQELRISAYDEVNNLIQILTDSGELLSFSFGEMELTYLTVDNICAVHATKMAAGADVFALEATDIKAGETVRVVSGFKVPEYLQGRMYQFFAMARSSFWENHKLLLTNGVGLIETDYPDYVKFSYCNMSDEDVHLQQGEKIGQLTMVKCTQFAPVYEVERTGGFGSTDKSDKDEKNNDGVGDSSDTDSLNSVSGDNGTNESTSGGDDNASDDKTIETAKVDSVKTEETKVIAPPPPPPVTKKVKK